MNIVLTHYLPPVGIGGCELVAMKLAEALRIPAVAAFGAHERAAHTGNDVSPPPGLDVYYASFPAKVDLCILVGHYQPYRLGAFLSRLAPGAVVWLPFFHLCDGYGRIRALLRHAPVLRQTCELIVCVTRREEAALRRLFPTIPILRLPYFPGVCAFDIRKKPPCSMEKPYWLYPVRPEKGYSIVLKKAQEHNRMLVVSRAYRFLPQTAVVQGNFDLYDYFWNAEKVVIPSQKDAFGISQCYCRLYDVPLDMPRGTQIEELWFSPITGKRLADNILCDWHVLLDEIRLYS